MESFKLLFDHIAWIEHQFLSGIRDSRKSGSLWGMKKGVRGRQSLLAKVLGLGLGLGLLCWGFKGIQEEIPSEEANTLQIGPVAVPDNAPVHKSILVTHYLTKRDTKTVPQLPNSPDLTPCDP